MVVETGATAGVFPARRARPAAGWPRRTAEDDFTPLTADPDAALRRGRARSTSPRWSRWSRCRRRRATSSRSPRSAGTPGRPGVRRVVGEQLVRGPRHRRRGAARPERAAGSGADGHPGLAADPGHDHRVRACTATSSPRARGCWSRCAGRASASARRRSQAPPVAAHVQPQLPRPQRHRRRRGVPVLAVDRRGQRADRRDHRPAHRGRRRELRPRRRPRTRRSTTTTSTAPPHRRARRAVVVERGANLVPPPVPGPLPETIWTAGC